MPQLQEKIYTSEDYWNLPDGERAELINGHFYPMAMPNTIHQRLVVEISCTIANYIDEHHVAHELIISPFAVNLTADEKIWVEPDIIICDKSKLSERACESAPEFLIEIVLPTSRKMDYITKVSLYADAGVREYWIVDPEKERTTVYRYEEDAAPTIIPFNQPVPVGIHTDLDITIADLLKE